MADEIAELQQLIDQDDDAVESPANAPSPPGPAANPPTAHIISRYGGRFPLSNADDVIWELRPGIQPFVGEFTREATVTEAWLKSQKADFISVEIAGRVFRKLRVLRAIQVDPWHVMFRVADRRHRWRYVRTFGRFNLRRRVNDNLRVVDLTAALEPEQVSESSLRDDLRTIAVQRYRRWSVKDGGEARTAKELAILTMLGILEALGEDPADFDQAGADGLPDNGEVPDMLEHLGATVEESLGSLLRRAELNVRVDDDGTIRFYDPFERARFPALSFKAGAYRRPDLSRIRPEVYEVYCLAEHDVRVKFQAIGAQTTTARVDDNKADVDPKQFLFCHNVLQLPEDTEINGTVHKLGTWVPVADALATWRISEADVRSLWFFGGEGLKIKYARAVSPNGVPYFVPRQLRRVQAILQHYRQSFMLHARLLDMLRSWKAETSAVIDPVSHARQPSPVFGEWYELFPNTPLLLAALVNSPNPPGMGQNMSSFAEYDVGRPGGSAQQQTSLDPPQTAPAELKVIDEDLGVFRVEYFGSLDGSVAERIPSRVDSEMQVFDPGVRQQLQFTSRNMKLASSFRLETVVSVIFGAPNSSETDPRKAEDLFYAKAFMFDEAEHGKGLVPRMQLFCRVDTARFNEHGELANADQIDALLEAEARSAARSFDDRPVGVFTAVHRRGDEWFVNGHVRAIRFTLDRNGSVKVIVDASEPEQGVSIMSFLSQPMRNWVQKTLPRET